MESEPKGELFMLARMILASHWSLRANALACTLPKAELLNPSAAQLVLSRTPSTALGSPRRPTPKLPASHGSQSKKLTCLTLAGKVKQAL